MIVSYDNGLKYLHFESFQNELITQAVFTRKGGNSKKPWSTLNVGNTVGDDPEHVKQNLSKILTTIEYREDQLAQVRQVHSSNVVRIDNPNHLQIPYTHADGMVTNQPDVLLLMRFADCVPILLFDPDNKAVGMAHAGWKGTVLGVAAEAAKKMVSEFGSDPERLIAGIGPSIGPDHYLIGRDVIKKIDTSFPERLDEILLENGDGVKLDLWKANRITLQKVGVKQIEVAEICTACNTQDWYSHRGEEGKTGRFAAVIGVKSQIKK
jgi:YfiH family protein